MIKRLTAFLFVFSIVFQLSAQGGQVVPSPIIFVYDASGSMWGQLQGKTKMQIAVDVLSNFIDNLPENQRIGFVAYGHRKKGDCKDVEFLISMENESKSKVIKALKNINPLGKTPLAFSAKRVIDKLRAAKQKATVILLTDGIESCGGDICDVIKTAKGEGIDFRLHIIGFGLKTEETRQLVCAVKAGGGKYYDAEDALGLTEALKEAASSTVDEPYGNFLVRAIKNGKPIDALVKAFRVGAGTEVAIDIKRTYAGVAHLYLPAGRYNLEVIPLENSDVKAITVANAESFDDRVVHKTISFDAGKIKVTALNNGQGWDAVVKVSAVSDGKRVAGGRTYGKTDEIELNPGLYEVELKALVVKGVGISHIFENVEVKANEVNELEYNFKTGIVTIGATSKSGLVDATVRIVDVNAKRTIANGRTYTEETNNPKKFILTPGTYEVTLVALGVHKGKKETFVITVKENETVTKIGTF